MYDMYDIREDGDFYEKMDLAGQTFGHLTVLAPAENDGIHTAWLCRCDCGNEVIVRTRRLRSGNLKSCGRSGCPHSRGRTDLTGRTFGHLTALAPAASIGEDSAWRCRCGCGSETVVRTDSLLSGDARSCGRAGCSCYGNRMDLTGRRYGHLTVLAPAENVNGRTAWLCKCDCGREAVVRSFKLREGRVKTCGDPECPYAAKRPPVPAVLSV